MKVELYCVNHPDLRWYTKPEAIWNGRYTGARSIFFDLHHQAPDATECECSADSLVVVMPSLAMKVDA